MVDHSVDRGLGFTLHLLDVVAVAKDVGAVAGRVQSRLVRSMLFLRFRRVVLAVLCALCASSAGWNIGITKGIGVISAALSKSVADNWIDWFKIESDILECMIPLWFFGSIALALVAFLGFGSVADATGSVSSDDKVQGRIVIPPTYRSRHG
ncbi:MAG: hypothetical protein IPK97_05790 [Ahniella sp.]|nr:hypothetical protein [Ahniella sp.]